MAVDLMHLTEVVKEALLRDLGEEVDLIFCYGSYLKGNTHAYSDLDISYVPVHEATQKHITVLVADMLCDLYPIRWSRLEQMANFENVSSTVLLNYQIIYQRSTAAAERMGRWPRSSTPCNSRRRAWLCSERRKKSSSKLGIPTICCAKRPPMGACYLVCNRRKEFSARCYTAWRSAIKPASILANWARYWRCRNCRWVLPRQWTR
jgi:hypothetical protein